MKKILSVVVLFLMTFSAFGQDLDQAYRKNFGATTIVATNGEYPPVGSCNPGQFEWQNGASHVIVSFDEPICLRAFVTDGKRFNDYFQDVLKKQAENLKFKQEDVFFWQLWSDHDESGNVIDAAKAWPKSVSDIPTWNRLGWFATKYEGEAGSWDTVGINRASFKENLMQYFSPAKAGQKFYLTLSVGYSYKVGAGQSETKWNHVLNKMETVVSSGELGFAHSPFISAGTIVVKENKTGN